MVQIRSNVGPVELCVRSGPILGIVVVQRKGPSSGEVDSRSLLVVIVVVVGSHLLHELAHHLGGLGVFLLEPLKDILDATLDHLVEGISISGGDVLLIDAIGDNVTEKDLAVALVGRLHIGSSLHDSSALIVFRGEVVLAAGGDGGQDGGVLLLGSPLSPPPSSSTTSASLASQRLGRHRVLEALLASSVLGGISIAGML